MNIKPFITIISSVLWLSSVCFSENVYVHIKQFAQIPGGQYAEEPSPSLRFSSLPEGKLNLKYDFDINTKKDKKNNFIDCAITFPAGIALFVTACDGIVGMKINGEQVPAILTGSNSAEFLIPVRTHKHGFLELQITIPESFVGRSIPIKINFEGYKEKGFFETRSWWNLMEVYEYIYKTNDESVMETLETKEAKDTFNVLKEKYVKYGLPDSLKRFTIQIRP